MVATTLPLVTVGVAVVVNYAWQAARPDPNSELGFARVTFRLGLAVGLLGATAVAGALCWFILPA